VSTDCEIIKKTVEDFNLPKVEVVGRSVESATDIASTELGMLEFSENYIFENIVLIQATSPLLRVEDLDNGFRTLDNADSVISVVRQKRFSWQENSDGYATPINYDYYNRPRRQDFDGYLIENGAFYITGRNALLNSKSRISGKIRAIEMSEESFIELDEPTDWDIVEVLLNNQNRKCIPQGIKMFLCDCDGTLTDSGMYYSENGEQLKKFNTRDGVGLRLLKEHGIITGIITGENSEIVKKRAEKLGVDEIFIGVVDKLSEIKSLCKKHKISISEVAYVGDDLNDVEAIKNVGFGCCTNDAALAIKSVAQYIAITKGGKGAVREVADYILSNVTVNQ